MYKKLYSIVFLFLVIPSIIAQTDYDTPQKITIYWDTSLSMESKDLAKEFELLSNYFSVLQNVEVELIVFSNSISNTKKFSIVNKDWSALKSVLLNTTYDGVSYYEILTESSETNDSEANLLFTDGIESIDKLIISTKKPTFIINSNKKVNHKLLRKQGVKSQGNYINLNEVDIEQSMSLLKVSLKNVPINRSNISNIQSSRTKKLTKYDDTIKGVVYSPEGVLEDASIIVVGKSEGIISDQNGKFEIKANKGDVLLVSFIGMLAEKVLIDNKKELEVFLESSPNALDEVVVKGNVAADIEVVETAHSKVDKKKLGYAVQSINDEDISLTITDIANAAQGKFSVSHEGNDISRMVMRGFTSINLNSFPLIIIDGTPIKRTDSGNLRPNFDSNFELRSLVDPNNVAKITILKGLAATNRYGSEGGNGVFLITTKTSVFKNNIKSKPYDRAKKRDNNYTENLTLLNITVNTAYIKELKKLKTLPEVYDYYLKQRKRYTDDLLYFIHVSDYIAQWGDKKLASKIFSNIIEIRSDDTDLLKLVAYKAEQNYDYLLARKAYEKIKELKPTDAQSYRDLALIYQETGYYQKALDIYNAINSNSIPNVDFSGLRKNINSELRRLISLHKKELDNTKISSDYMNSTNYDARIVFDWNDVNAEFELQFVNPQKSFFTWSHTKAKNALRLNNEKNNGFNSEEFLLINAPKGEWLINIENKSRKSIKKPIAIKYTVYRNYGKPNETKELKIILLNTISKKQTIGKISI